MASCSSEVTQSIYHACAKWRFEKQQQRGIGVGVEEENMTYSNTPKCLVAESVG